MVRTQILGSYTPWPNEAAPRWHRTRMKLHAAGIFTVEPDLLPSIEIPEGIRYVATQSPRARPTPPRCAFRWADGAQCRGARGAHPLFCNVHRPEAQARFAVLRVAREAREAAAVQARPPKPPKPPKTIGAAPWSFPRIRLSLSLEDCWSMQCWNAGTLTAPARLPELVDDDRAPDGCPHCGGGPLIWNGRHWLCDGCDRLVDPRAPIARTDRWSYHLHGPVLPFSISRPDPFYAEETAMLRQPAADNRAFGWLNPHVTRWWEGKPRKPFRKPFTKRTPTLR